MTARFSNLCLLGALLSTFLIIHEPWAMKLTRTLIAIGFMLQLQKDVSPNPTRLKLAKAAAWFLSAYAAVALVFTLIDFKAEVVALLN